MFNRLRLDGFGPNRDLNRIEKWREWKSCGPYRIKFDLKTRLDEKKFRYWLDENAFFLKINF